MKFTRPSLLATLALVSLTSCGNGLKKSFGDYYGEYRIESSSLQSTEDLCPLTEATIGEEALEGGTAVGLFARSNPVDGNCRAEMKYLISIDGLKGVSCDRSPGYSRCEREGAVFEAKMTEQDGLVRLETWSHGSEDKRQVWLLRRR